MHLLKHWFLELSDLTLELDEYIKGGADNEHNNFAGLWSHPKPQAEK